jgi:hypothetical protein
VPQNDKESTEIWGVVWEEIEFAWRIVRSALYVCFWRARHYLWRDPDSRKLAKRGLRISAVVLFIKIVLFLFLPEIASWLAVLLGSVAAMAVLLLSSFVLALHHLHEAAANVKQLSLAQHIRPARDLMLKIAKAPPDQKQQALDSFVESLLTLMHRDFAERLPTNVNAMFPDHEGKLRIVYLVPVGTKYDPDICFDPGQGGAGFCFQESNIVYIPDIRYMHAIIVGMPSDGAGRGKIKYGLKRRLYVPIQPEFEVYRSIVCVPITSPSGTHGVLNLDSTLSDAFDSHDFHVLNAYASLLGYGISVCG